MCGGASVRYSGKSTWVSWRDLFAERLVGGGFDAAVVELMRNHRLSERVYESQQSLRHRVNTARWLAAAQDKLTYTATEPLYRHYCY